ncbi:hypothetical protein LPJ63_003085 [Coemansia sp. RSA 2711]|nr:hypothetical protein LPJ63_003085 [Coemansia sp. RSA 2711]
MLSFILVAVLLLCATVQANTEIRHFRPTVISNHHRCLDQLSPAVLLAPHTSTEVVKLAALENTDADLSEKAHWYCLRDLEHGHSYELRVSYAATTPSDFNIDIFTGAEMQRLFNASDLATHAKVTASYAGVSNVPGMENVHIPYIFVLDAHVWGLPTQALKLIAVLAVVIAFSLLFVTPRLVAAINSVLSEPDVPSKQD